MELLEEGAQVLTQEMVKGGWSVVQGWIVRIFQGNETKRKRALGEVEESRRELEGSSPISAQEVEQAWRVQLRRLLREDPGAQAELRALVEEVAGQGGGGTTNIAGDVHGTLIQAGIIKGGVHQSENRYEGDHIDMRGSKAEGDVTGVRYNDGTRPRRD